MRRPEQRPREKDTSRAQPPSSKHPPPQPSGRHQYKTSHSRRLTIAERVLRRLEIYPPPPRPRPGQECLYRVRARLTWLLEQMMYVSGETAEASVETTGIIEDIVRQQVIELVGTFPLFPPARSAHAAAP